MIIQQSKDSGCCWKSHILEYGNVVYSDQQSGFGNFVNELNEGEQITNVNQKINGTGF